MSSDDSSGVRPAAPVVLRIKLRYEDVDSMVQRFASNVGKSGLFLPTKSLQPIGAEIKFELRLSDDTPALVGLGRVKAATPPDPGNPKATFGMAIELMRVTPQSRALILRMLEHRRALGLAEVGLPSASDIDAARRIEAATAATPAAATHAAAAPAAMREALLTAPRRTTGPLAVATVLAVAPLAPEQPRRKRLAVSQVIESASGPIASVATAVPGIDDDVDLAAALTRARALAGASLDAELDALAEVAAAPVEISIEAASAELARQLGGSAVRRDRSARWATPPATAAPEEAVAVEALSAADAVAEAPPVAAAAVEAAPAEAAAVEAAPIEAAPVEAAAVDAAPVEAVPVEVAAVETAAVEAAPGEPAEAEPAAPVELYQVDGDGEEVESTEMGDIPGGPTSFEHGFATEPSVADQLVLAAKLDAAPVVPLDGVDGTEPPTDISLEEIDDFEILAEADAEDEDLLTSHGEHDASLSRDAIALPDDGERLPSEPDFASRLDLDDDSDVYYTEAGTPVSRSAPFGLRDDVAEPTRDFGDAARLARRHAESARQALAGFELGDEPSDPGDAPGDPHRVVQPIFDPDSSSNFTLAGTPPGSVDLELPIAEPEPRRPRAPRSPAGALRPAATPNGGAVSSTQPPAPAAQPARAPRPTPQPAPPPRAQRSTQPPTPTRPPTRAQRPSQQPLPQSLLDTPVQDHELEHALEALDVDLDDLAIPHAATQLQREHDPSRSRPGVTIRPPLRSAASRAPLPSPAAAAPPRPAGPRVTTEDGVLIDFDDEDE